MLWGGCGAEGARFLGMEEAAGSSPASSTIIYQKGGNTGRARPWDGRFVIN